MKNLKSTMHILWIVLMVISAIACMASYDDANSLGTIAGAIILSVLGIVEFVLRK